MAVRGIFVFVILRGAVELLRMGLNRSLEILARLIRESGERISGTDNPLFELLKGDLMKTGGKP